MRCNRASAAGDLPEPLCEKELVAFLLSLSVKDLHSHLLAWDQGLRKQHANKQKSSPRVTQPLLPQTQIRARLLHLIVWGKRTLPAVCPTDGQRQLQEV